MLQIGYERETHTQKVSEWVRETETERRRETNLQTNRKSLLQIGCEREREGERERELVL